MKTEKREIDLALIKVKTSKVYDARNLRKLRIAGNQREEFSQIDSEITETFGLSPPQMILSKLDSPQADSDFLNTHNMFRKKYTQIVKTAPHFLPVGDYSCLTVSSDCPRKLAHDIVELLSKELPINRIAFSSPPNFDNWEYKKQSSESGEVLYADLDKMRKSEKQDLFKQLESDLRTVDGYRKIMGYPNSVLFSPYQSILSNANFECDHSKLKEYGHYLFKELKSQDIQIPEKYYGEASFYFHWQGKPKDSSLVGSIVDIDTVLKMSSFFASRGHSVISRIDSTKDSCHYSYMVDLPNTTFLANHLRK